MLSKILGPLIHRYIDTITLNNRPNAVLNIYTKKNLMDEDVFPARLFHSGSFISATFIEGRGDPAFFVQQGIAQRIVQRAPNSMITKLSASRSEHGPPVKHVGSGRAERTIP